MSKVHFKKQLDPDFDWPEFWRYNAKDSSNLLQIQEEQAALLKARGTENVFRQEMDLCYPLIAIEMKGIKIDLSRKEELKEQNTEIVRKLCFFFSCLIQGPLSQMPAEQRKTLDVKSSIQKVGVNINSPKQLKEFLYTKCKLPKRVYQGKLTTNVDALMSLIPYDPPLMQTILLIREYSTKNRFYNITVDSDSRMRTTFKPGGTATGRLSSSKSIVGTGFNLQTIFKEARVFFVPDDGYYLIQIDYSKAESWIVAYLAEDEKMLDGLRGPDFHSYNASNILGKPVTKKNYTDRQLGKRISHACWDASAEVLTREGWVRFDELQDNTPIAQWDPNSTRINFVIPSHITRADYSGQMIKMEGISYDHYVTPEHKMLYRTSQGYIREDAADSFITRKSCRMPVTGLVESEDNMNPDLVRLAVATQADGNIDKSEGIRFHLRKERKISRLLEILTKLGLEYSSNVYDDNLSLRISQKDSTEILALLKPGKVFGDWIYNVGLDTLEIILEEVLHWDGRRTECVRNRQEYSTTNKENAYIIQTVAHLAGRQALVRESIDKRGDRKPLYTVSFNKRQFVRFETLKNVQKEDYTGKVYCVTVPSGAFMVRRSGNIMVSGNSNYGMTSFLLQKVLLRDGYSYTKKECQEFIDLYFDAYPNIKSNYHLYIQHQLKKDKTLVTPFGRKITYWEPWGNDLLNKAYAFIPQSTVGDMTNRGLLNIYHNIVKPRLDILLQVHDSVVLQVHREDITPQLIEDLKQQMIMPITIKGRTFEIPVDIELGRNWYELEDWNDLLEHGVDNLDDPDRVGTALDNLARAKEEEEARKKLEESTT